MALLDTEETSSNFSQEPQNPVALPLPKSGHANPIHMDLKGVLFEYENVWMDTALVCGSMTT